MLKIVCDMVTFGLADQILLPLALKRLSLLGTAVPTAVPIGFTHRDTLPPPQVRGKKSPWRRLRFLHDNRDMRGGSLSGPGGS